MKLKTKNALRALAKHLGLQVRFVDYFTPDIRGKLLPREKRILLNAHDPKCEHVFTLLHEIGHFVVHCGARRRKYHPRIFDVNWRNDWLASFSSVVRRYFRQRFNSSSGKEWEADLWAMCALIIFSNRFGARPELNAFLERHPEKINLFLLAVLGSVYSEVKTRFVNISRTILTPCRQLVSAP